MILTDFIGHDDAKLALTLNAVDPRCGGVLFAGEKGSGKSTLARLFRSLLPPASPFVTVPLNATEDAVLGGIDLEKSLKKGLAVSRRGLLDRASGGIVYIDDVNLLAPEIVALVLKGQDGTAIYGNDGGKTDRLQKRETTFVLLGSMNPDEGHLSSHVLDRFGMCVLWEGLKDSAGRLAVMKSALARESTLVHGRRPLEEIGVMRELLERIRAARLAVNGITVHPDMMDAIASRCLENCVAGHRGDVFLFYAARAYAAFQRAREITAEHIEAVLPLVLLHRKRLLRQMEEPPRAERQRQENRSEHDKRPDDNKTDRQADGDASASNGEPLRDNDSGQTDDGGDRSRESREKEETFAVGEAFKMKRLAFRKDRIVRNTAGRRTKTATKAKRGRQIRSILKPNGDIAVDATIRAAAPFQQARGRRSMLIIRDEDMRFRQREKKTGHLVVMVLDGSGSMGAQKRMIETKGAVQSLLIDCYRKRDMVSLIVFRKDHAEVVLPPTSSVVTAARRLADVPVGGKTPLSAGLLETYRLIGRVRTKSPETRFLVVLVTDGRANQTLTGGPAKEEIQKMTGLLNGLPSTDYVVVDTENKRNFLKADLAREIASSLGADYYGIDDLKADHLTDIVRARITDTGAMRA
jgi:magnesium chelatase subunit D